MVQAPIRFWLPITRSRNAITICVLHFAHMKLGRSAQKSGHARPGMSQTLKEPLGGEAERDGREESEVVRQQQDAHQDEQ